MKKLKIKTKDTGKRIDVFLATSLPDTTRSQIQKLIKQELVTVNGQSATCHHKLKGGDIIEIGEEKKEPGLEASRPGSFFYSNSELSSGYPELSSESANIEIIDKTKEFLIINKPAHLTVHGANHIKSITLVDLLLKKFPSLKKIGEDPARPGIVHRLDKEVSGLMVIPRTQDSFDNIKMQFQKRIVKKTYTALVYGAINKEADEIKFPIKRSADGFKMAAIPETNKKKINLDGRISITEFRILKHFINYTLLQIRIKTGRTHQIRVHLLAYGHPIVGDNLYNTKKTREQNTKLNLNRLFLVANKLSFTDLKGKLCEYVIDLPLELTNFLKKIK